MKRQHVSCRIAGFTLVEMLVVIGIIAVLAAIIYPAYQGAIERGRQTNCLSNLHTIALAAKIYRMDNKQYPVHLSDLYPDYISSSKALVCRDDTSNIAALDSSGRLVYSSYYANAAGSYSGTPATFVDPSGASVYLDWNYNGLASNGHNKSTPDANWGATYKGMVNPNAPDSTVITHCEWHRPFYKNTSSQMDTVVRIGGDASVLKTSYDWVNQPEQ